MKNCNSLLWTVIVVLWLAVFFMLTPLALLVSGRSLPKASIDITNSPYQVHYSIDVITVNENLFKDVEVAGWSFIENDSDNENKEVFLIFVSDKRTYQVKLNVFDRGDLPSALPNLLVPKRNSGFLGSFSLIALKNGVYHLYIYNREDQELCGVADTGRKFLVQNAVFKEIFISEELKVTKPDELSGLIIRSNIDSCTVSDNILNVSGWAFVEGSESAGLTMVRLTKSNGDELYFSTISVDRPDVVDYFGKSELALSGFKASIPLEGIGTDEFTLRIFFEGVGTSSNSCSFPLQGNKE